MSSVYEIFADPVVFSTYFFPYIFYYKVPDFHKAIWDALKEMRPRQLIVAPRGTAKSTIVSFGWILYNICFGLSSLTVLISESFTKACIHLDRIKEAIETNKELRESFNISPGEPWSKGDMVINTPFGKSRLIAKGGGQSIRGLVQNKRVELLVIDDVESEALMRSKSSRESIKSWFFGQVIPAVEPKSGRIIVIGTNLHYDSLIATLLNDKETWNPLVFKILQEDGTSIWEERFPVKFINKIKDEYVRSGRIHEFYAEYMNEPVPESENLLDTSFIRFFDKFTLKKKLTYYIGVDPGASLEDKADNTAIAVVAHDDEGNIFLMDIVAGKFLPSRTLEHIIQFTKYYPIRKIGIEAVGAQRGLFHAFDEELKSMGEYLPLYPIKQYKGSKRERILAYLEPKISAGKFYIDPTDFNHKEFLNELNDFVSGVPSKDDRLDAVAIAISLMDASIRQSPKASFEETQYEPLKIYLP